jgi:putative ABC transport system substrate-binding protein
MANLEWRIGRMPAFIVALALTAVGGPLAADTQQTRHPYRIGVVHAGFFPNTPPVEGLRAGLKALGLEEGRDVILDIRPTKGDLRLARAATTALAGAGVDLIFAEGEQISRAAMGAAQTVPIVFVRVGDPVVAGFVASIPHPGGNLTGISSLDTDLTPKRLQVLKAIFPTVRRVWAVYHPDDLSSGAAARKAQEVAALLKVEVVARAVRTPEELVSQLKSLQPGDGLLSPPTVTMNIPGMLLDLQLMARWPAIFYTDFWVQAGALVSYGSPIRDDSAQSARLVVRILRGERPRDLPVEGPNKIELTINSKTAKSLGITIPREILERADRIIE